MSRKILNRSLNQNRNRAIKNRQENNFAEAYLASSHHAVESIMAAAESLPDFRKTQGNLAHSDKLLIVEQALILIEQNYVHLPLKESMHAVRPVQALRRLQQKLQSGNDQISELDFHKRMLKIFNSVQDLHTNYTLPSPYNEKTAFVPFLLETYFKDGEQRFLVAHLIAGYSHATFVEGVEITMWNGAPIHLAVEANSKRFSGSNKAAQLARGLERMTVRPLAMSLPPDENFVLIEYQTSDGERREIRLNWLVFTPDLVAESGLATKVFDETDFAMGMDWDMYISGQAKKCLFAPNVLALETSLQLEDIDPKKEIEVGEIIAGLMPGKLSAKTVETDDGQFGYIRIHSFHVEDHMGFVEEFIRLAGHLPQRGLIIDVRGNGGGSILAGEHLLQILTPGTIEPEPAQFINSSLNLEIVRRHAPSYLNGFDLSPWKESMEESVGTGAVYSRGFPITDADSANSIGQRYQGPVVLVTDAKCYSTTDIFSAGFQDHEIGKIIGVDDNTGAGGANVWEFETLKYFAGAGSVYKSLPSGANMRVAMRRTLRVGEKSGTPVEDLGVKPDILYEMTRGDLLEGNKDLIAFATSQLIEMPLRQLRGQMMTLANADVEVDIQTNGLTRVDVYLDDRPIGAIDVENGDSNIKIPNAGDFDILYLYGFDGEDLAAAWRLESQ